MNVIKSFENRTEDLTVTFRLSLKVISSLNWFFKLRTPIFIRESCWNFSSNELSATFTRVMHKVNLSFTWPSDELSPACCGIPFDDQFRQFSIDMIKSGILILKNQFDLKITLKDNLKVKAKITAWCPVRFPKAFVLAVIVQQPMWCLNYRLVLQ